MVTVEFSIYALVMFAVTLLAILLLIYPLFLRPRSKLSYYFLALIASTALWCGAYTWQILVIEKELQMITIYIQYIGIVALTPTFLLFVLAFTNRNELSEKPILALLYFPPILHYLFLITNDFHNLFYLSVELNTESPFTSLNLTYGPAFYSHTIYSYTLIAVAIFYLLRSFKLSAEGSLFYRRQIGILLIGSVFPIMGNIIRIFRLIPPLVFLDLTPIFFVVCYILFAYAIYEFGFLDIVPIARHKVFEEIMDGIVVLNREMNVIDINSTAGNMLLPQLDLSTIYGKNIFKTLKGRTNRKQDLEEIKNIEKSLFEMAMGKKDTHITEFEVYSGRDPSKRHFYELIIKPIQVKGGENILGYLGILHDISDRKKAETALKDKNQLLDLILKLLSHDLRNHLNVLKGYTELATDAALRSDMNEIDESLIAINVKTGATLKLMEEITNFLKAEEQLKGQQFEEICLEEIIRLSVNQLQPEIEEKEINLNMQFTKEPACVLANLAINSVIFNLLMNAIKFSPRKGKIQIILEDYYPNWRVSIIDEGPGIPNELKEQIFEPFVSFGKDRGTGLGLTIARTTIQSFIGSLWVEDNEPTGSKFIFEVPQYNLDD